MPTPSIVYKRVQRNRRGNTISYQRPNTVFRMIPKNLYFSLFDRINILIL